MKKFITDQIQEEAILSLEKIVNHESVFDPTDIGEGHPFGKRVLAVLEEVLGICDTLGFKTFKDPEGYYGYAEVGEGEKLFGIVCHLDVVPAKEQSGWKTDPFKFVHENGLMIGRGVQDDKGPTVANIYALKALIDAGVQFDGRVRLIFGTDEETLFRCMQKYNEKEEAPTMGYVPDSGFPLTYAEKGLLQAYFIGSGTDQFSVKTGGASNVVPDKSIYNSTKLEEIKAKLTEHQFDFEENPDGIIVQGKSVHAQKAPQGINAVSRLAIALSEVFDFAPIDFLGKLVGENATGEYVLGKTEDEISGELTMNFANIEVTSEYTKIGVDLRVPVTVEKSTIVQKLTEKAGEYGLKYEELDWLDPLYIPLESELIQKLLSAYRDYTGDMTAPKVSGGATFARMVKNTVAFGAMLPETPLYAHQANEQWQVEHMRKAMEIYAEAIYQLCGNKL